MKALNPTLKSRFYRPDDLPPIDYYPCGIQKVDALLGGGLAAGRVLEFYGPKGMGKTTLALTFHPDVFIDVERTAESGWFQQLAPGTEVVQPKSAEEAWELVLTAAKAEVRLVVLDSLGAMVTQDELEDSGGRASLARSVSHYLRAIIPCLNTTALLVLNQVRATMNSTIPGLTHSPGGFLFEHLCTQKVEFKPRGEWVTITKEGVKTRIGHAVRLYLQKNKLGWSYQEAVLYLAYGHGFVETEDEVKLLYAQGGATYGQAELPQRGPGGLNGDGGGPGTPLPQGAGARGEEGRDRP